MNELQYLSGFGSYFQSEAVPGALPVKQNSPQQSPLGLYPEQLSGTAFTAPRTHNFYSWLYRINPSVKHGDFQPYTHYVHWQSAPLVAKPTPPTQMRWAPLPLPTTPTDFIDGMITFAAHGSVQSHTGAAIHQYVINQSMQNRYFYNADGDLLIVPQAGRLFLQTEFGRLTIGPEEIAVIPRGIKFQVQLLDELARGYVCENYGAHFSLPDLGPIGANGLAHPRHFLTPVAHYEQKTGEFALIAKFQGHLWQAALTHSPCDVVAWHGNYVPYKYDLRLYNTINTVSYDHPDPSIFTVLTARTDTPGVANVDFVIFPPRWMVAEHTFRPPYYHRNLMSEFMGLIKGQYDAKPDGFVPGGASLHNCMAAHGPDAEAATRAMQQSLTPERYTEMLAFMFESYYPWQLTDFAMTTSVRQTDYLACWQSIPVNFKL